MRKLFSFIAKIISVVVAFSLLTMLFMPKYIDVNTDGRITSEFYREKTPIDVIFTGTSTVQAGISPMALYRDYGIAAYDRSNSSQTIVISNCMIKDAIMRNKPSLVVCDVGYIYQPDDYVDEAASRKSLDGLRWSKYKSECINEVMDPSENYLDYVFPILRFHSRWNDLKVEDIRYLIYKPNVTHNGQLLRFDVMSKDKEYIPYGLDEGIVATSRSIRYLQDIVDTCKNNDIEVLLIKLPFYNGNWNEALDKQITDFADQNDVVYKNFIDEFDKIGFDPIEEFADGQHMNAYGADRFSQHIGKYICSNYSIPDRRNDEKIKNVFDKKLERYEYDMKNRIPAEKNVQK